MCPVFFSVFSMVFFAKLFCPVEGTLPFYSVYRSSNSVGWEIRQGKGGLATAYYNDRQLNSTGWNVLHISTNNAEPDKDQAYAAGFLEGYLTREHIWNSFLSANESFSYTEDITHFILDQDNWVRSMAASSFFKSDYWAQVQFSLSQFDGLFTSYNYYSPAEQQISPVEFLYFVLSAEISDIQSYVDISKGRVPNTKNLAFGSHCSVLVRLSSDGQRLFSAHDTWSNFSNMLRIYKFYNFNFNHPSTKVRTIAFPSYPADLQSTDDFYILDNNMVISETTNEVFNLSLYSNYMSTKTVPEWIRIIVANRMSMDGESWVSVFKQFNSGTYNNQWQIIDFKKFTPGQKIAPGTLWIAEQIPGMVVSADKSDFLATQGFWPSYNIPYFPEVYNISGYPDYFKRFGNTYSYSECARAQIFRRDAPNVQTMQDMKRIMRYNEYQTDPLSLKDACRGISARCDLNTPWTENPLNDYSAFGGIDSKITESRMVPLLEVFAVSGPTWDSLPPFAWTNQWKDVPSHGQPRVFAFDFVDMKP